MGKETSNYSQSELAVFASGEQELARQLALASDEDHAYEATAAVAAPPLAFHLHNPLNLI